jgi:hypothetical protein
MAAARALCAIGLVVCVVLVVAHTLSGQGSGGDITIYSCIGASLAIVLIALSRHET